MRLGPSPYFCLRTLLLALEIIVDVLYPHALDNLFWWDSAVLNLPDMPSFDTTFSWVYKWDDACGCVAAAVKSYIDDLRLMCLGDSYMPSSWHFALDKKYFRHNKWGGYPYCFSGVLG